MSRNYGLNQAIILATLSITLFFWTVTQVLVKNSWDNDFIALLILCVIVIASYAFRTLFSSPKYNVLVLVMYGVILMFLFYIEIKSFFMSQEMISLLVYGIISGAMFSESVLTYKKSLR